MEVGLLGVVLLMAVVAVVVVHGALRRRAGPLAIVGPPGVKTLSRPSTLAHVASFIIDVVAVGCLTNALMFAQAHTVPREISMTFMPSIVLLLSTVPSLVLLSLRDAFGGACSPGNLLCAVRVVDETGEVAGMPASVLRNGKLAAGLYLPALIGAVVVLLFGTTPVSELVAGGLSVAGVLYAVLVLFGRAIAVARSADGRHEGDRRAGTTLVRSVALR